MGHGRYDFSCRHHSQGPTVKVRRSIQHPAEPAFEGRWTGAGRALISCWQEGRELAIRYEPLRSLARAGHLPVLPWRGGVVHPAPRRQYGTYFYLAMLQGLREQDLDIDLMAEVDLVCAGTGVTVTFTNDYVKLYETDDQPALAIPSASTAATP